MNLFTKRPEWLYKALGLTSPGIPQYLNTDAVIPTLDIAQGGWAHARYSTHAVELSVAGGILIGPPALPVAAGGLVTSLDDLTIVLGMSVYNGSAGAFNFNPFLTNQAPPPPVTGRVLLGIQAIAAGAAIYQNTQATGMASIGAYLPLVIPPGYALGESSGGAIGCYCHMHVVRLPAGVKAL